MSFFLSSFRVHFIFIFYFISRSLFYRDATLFDFYFHFVTSFCHSILFFLSSLERYFLSHFFEKVIKKCHRPARHHPLTTFGSENVFLDSYDGGITNMFFYHSENHFFLRFFKKVTQKCHRPARHHPLTTFGSENVFFHLFLSSSCNAS
jgi:hypothetical protein